MDIYSDVQQITGPETLDLRKAGISYSRKLGEKFTTVGAIGKSIK